MGNLSIEEENEIFVEMNFKLNKRIKQLENKIEKLDSKIYHLKNVIGDISDIIKFLGDKNG